MTIYLVLGLLALVVGLVIGRIAIVKARQNAESPEQAARRVRTIQYSFLALGAALLIFGAIEEPKHRYFNLAVVVIMAAGVAFDWIRARRKRERA
jgi:hypothetical protein